MDKEEAEAIVRIGVRPYDHLSNCDAVRYNGNFPCSCGEDEMQAKRRERIEEAKAVLTPEWCINMAKAEGDASIGAGIPDQLSEAREVLEDLELCRGLIQEAKGREGPNGGYVTDHLDHAEHWLDGVRDFIVNHTLTTKTAPLPGAAIQAITDNYSKVLPEGWQEILEELEDRHDIYIGDANDYDPCSAPDATREAFLTDLLAALRP